MSDTSNFDYNVYSERLTTEYEKQRPFMLLKPKMTRIGEAWQVQYGDVSAQAETPDAASRAFDKVWANGEIK